MKYSSIKTKKMLFRSIQNSSRSQRTYENFINNVINKHPTMPGIFRIDPETKMLSNNKDYVVKTSPNKSYYINNKYIKYKNSDSFYDEKTQRIKNKKIKLQAMNLDRAFRSFYNESNKLSLSLKRNLVRRKKEELPNNLVFQTLQPFEGRIQQRRIIKQNPEQEYTINYTMNDYLKLLKNDTKYLLSKNSKKELLINSMKATFACSKRFKFAPVKNVFE